MAMLINLLLMLSYEIGRWIVTYAATLCLFICYSAVSIPPLSLSLSLSLSFSLSLSLSDSTLSPADTYQGYNATTWHENAECCLISR